MMLNKKHINPTKSLVAYHILRANVVQMLEGFGYDLKQRDWSFHYNPERQGLKPNMLLTFHGQDKDLEFGLSMTGNYLSGRTKFFLYTSPFSGHHIGLKSNDVKYINCRECSGRRFTSDSNLTQMLDNKTLCVTPCSTCNDNYNLSGEVSL